MGTTGCYQRPLSTNVNACDWAVMVPSVNKFKFMFFFH